ncbi:MAG TPA: ornithine cyclodeaminase family protein [Motilibacteraceae bacterium]|nr:ornithine cyclodeaminase family protein [Motilibacteraceae bacterium]
MNVPVPWIDAASLRRLVPPTVAVDALERALREGLDPAAGPARSVVDVAAGQLLLMPAQAPAPADRPLGSGNGEVGVKVATVAPGNPARGLPRIQGLYLLLDGDTLAPRALVDAVELTVLRTAAVSALAARHLAVPDARRLVVLGTGPQARGHVQSLAAVRPIAEVTVVGRDAARRERLAAWCRGSGLRTSALAATEPAAVEEQLAAADVVVAATTARDPLFDGTLVRDTACVIAVGSHEPDARELDATLLRRSTVVVEDTGTALREAGDVVLAIGEGALRPADLVDLRALVLGHRPEPGRPRVFKSVGMAWQDLVVASAAAAATAEATGRQAGEQA